MAAGVHRIAVVIPKYGLAGGAEGFAAALTARLAEDPRWAFHVFAHRWLPSPGIHFHRVPILPFPRSLSAPSFAWFADRAIRRTGVDLIHAHDRILTADCFTMHGVPHRFWVREVRRKRPSLHDRAMIRLEEGLVRDPRCRSFLAVSRLAGEIFRQEHGVAPERIQVIPPGVDAAPYAAWPRDRARAELGRRFGTPAGERLLLFVSMNFELKGLDTLIGALARLAAASPAAPVRLLVAGKGNARKYQALAASLGVGGQVTFAGVLPREALIPLYAAADLLVMLSQFDTFGMVVLEAMAASLPVLVSDRVGARDLVREGVNGRVIPAAADAATLAAALAGLLGEGVREGMGEAARRTAQACTWEAAAARVAALYEGLLRGRPAGGGRP